MSKKTHGLNMQTLFSELQLEGLTVLCWILMILAVSRWVSPLLYLQLILPLSSVSLSSLFSVKQMCAQNRTCSNALIRDYWRYPNAPRMLGQWSMFICYQLFANQPLPSQLTASFNSRTWFGAKWTHLLYQNNQRSYLEREHPQLSPVFPPK